MNKKGLAVLLRTRMRRPSADSSRILLPTSSESSKPDRSPHSGKMDGEGTEASTKLNASPKSLSCFEFVRNSMHSVITIEKPGVLDPIVNDFSEGYCSLSLSDRQKLLVMLARDYYLDRMQVRDLLKQYLTLELPNGDNSQQHGVQEESSFSAFYRLERNLTHALKPIYSSLFEKLNMHSGGLKFLSDLRADILSLLAKENIGSLKALDSYLKEKLAMCITPAALQLHRITWDDSASLLEKIVAYEAVHPISSLIDLKRRLGVGRLCYGYLHPAIPGEPLIFIEVALLKNIAQTIQEVLWDDPPISEREAKCALFYSISSTQPGLAGINLGKFLIKRVIELVKRDMPHISTFATLSPIPGFMHWLLAKLVSQSKLSESCNVNSSHSFFENILQQEEETAILSACSEFAAERSGMEVMMNLLMQEGHEWATSCTLCPVLQRPLMRLCSRYLLHEKKRGKALDSVANFHLQNGAEIGRLNWMADRSDKGLLQSGGIMVNYVYRFENIEKNAESYFSTGRISASHDLYQLNEGKVELE